MSAPSGTAGGSGVRRLAGLVLLALAVRLLSLGLYPLADTTESRYAEIARKMVVMGDWVTPWYDSGIPFWAKPPLSTWVTASSFQLFGFNEFGARLPHFLGGAFVLWMTWRWLRTRSRREAILAVALLCSAATFYVSAGAVMTDMLLCVGSTLFMIAFWRDLESPRWTTRAGMVAGLLAGLLAKGPIVLVLTSLPVTAWCIFTRQPKAAVRALPWAGLSMLLAAPWYLMAEVRTPGFLDYFLVGEHWKRFTSSGWAGDMYGTAHAYPRGSIWVFAMIACLPWTLLLPWFLRGRHVPITANTQDHGASSWRFYLLAWGLTPCIFFTMSGNVLSTYVLPGLPALAALVGGWLAKDRRARRVELVVAVGLLVPTTVLFGFAVSLGYLGSVKTTRAMVAKYEATHRKGEPLVFLAKRPYSASFYSRGEAVLVRDTATLVRLLPGACMSVALHRTQVHQLPSAVLGTMTFEGNFRDYGLYRTACGILLSGVSGQPRQTIGTTANGAALLSNSLTYPNPS